MYARNVHGRREYLDSASREYESTGIPNIEYGSIREAILCPHQPEWFTPPRIAKEYFPSIIALPTHCHFPQPVAV